MIDVKPYILPEVVDRNELLAWRKSLQRPLDIHCPSEVREFIDAVAAKLPDFGQIRKTTEYISGYELSLSGYPVQGELSDVYPIDVPYKVAVDHRASMLRSYRKRGKAGLLAYCKVWVKDTELEQLLRVLNEQVFNEQTTTFRQVMRDIQKAKKID